MPFTSPLKPSPDPRPVAPERVALAEWLDYHRAELLAKIDGLDDEQAARRVVPSLNTLHGLVRHLTKVEHVWFVTVMLGSDEPAPFGFPDRRDGDFLLDDDATLEQDVARFLRACERSRAIYEQFDLDDVGEHRRIGQVDLRWVMLHMIEEYAQHNGHADILRELIDGTTQS
ncbi:DinB family protein [Actinospica robiniae]|uniref:DinB family protein n=1 Tax=Actinospica robiniae TaxID=304901 RepID=UPI0004297ACF|nr:DinB family protein [Actinospica robiniae]